MRYQTRRTKKRLNHGMTMIELLVVTIVIGILVAVGIPNLIGSQDRSKNASVKGNMRVIQLAAESYGVDAGGYYPTDIDTAFLSYLPGGSNDGTLEGISPVNPWTDAEEEPTLGGGALDAAAVNVLKHSPPGTLGRGEIQYDYDGAEERTYGIVGGGADNKMLIGVNGTNTTFVLSNVE